MTESILPQQYAEREHALEASFGFRLASIQSPALTLWNADTCSLPHLPHLAASLSVDFWDEEWPEATKREMVKQAPELHRIKGTPAGVVTALRILGYANNYLREHFPRKHNRKFTRNDGIQFKQAGAWYEFDVFLDSGVKPDASAITKLLLYIKSFKATHSRLVKALRYKGKHNSQHQHNSAITYGKKLCERIFYDTRKRNGQHKRDGSITYDGGLVYG